MVLRCNHTIIYEGQEERQGPLRQLLQLSEINSVYNMFTLSLEFHVTASLHIPGRKPIIRAKKCVTLQNFEH